MAFFIDRLAWLPDWLVSTIILFTAAALAVLFHRLALLALSSLIRADQQFLRRLLERTRIPTRWAVINFAVGAAVPLAPLSEEAAAGIGKALTASFIGLIGWMSVNALDVAVALHLRRYRLDVADNLLARKHVTQARILRRAGAFIIVVLTIAAALMTFDSVRQYGVSLLAAGGAAGVIVGLAAQPVLSNLFAGLQLALTQPIRIDDAVIVEGEWGQIEEITATYVVVKIWDWRRLIVPLRYFIEQPFQNWTRENADLIGVVLLYLDYRTPIERLRRQLQVIAEGSPLWDRRVVGLQVTDAREEVMEVRVLVSARNAGAAFDLRCDVREKLIAWIQREVPEALPVRRAEIAMPDRLRAKGVTVVDEHA